jgi:RNA polymerase sigma-70 factor (ECF subfamily)
MRDEANATRSSGYERARAEWPGIDVTCDDFMAHVRRHDADDSAHLPDLYFALACSMGDTRALRLFTEKFAGELTRAAGRTRNSGLPSDELQQAAHALFFVARHGAPPKIAEYAGRGSLRGWVRVVLARLVVDHTRTLSGHEPVFADPEVVCALTDQACDPELAVMKAQYRREVKLALESAFDELDRADKALLRHRYLEGLVIDQIAVANGMPRATAARRLAQAERSLRIAAHRALAERLNIGTAEFASALRAILSQFELSLARILA